MTTREKSSASASQAPPQEWRDIASAPKQGSILLMHPRWREPRIGRWFPSPYDDGGGFYEANCSRVEAMWWHPLPVGWQA